MFRCKGPDGVIRSVTKRFIKNAWVAAITVCTDNLYKRTSVVVQEAFEGLLGVTSRFSDSLRSLRTNTLYSIDPEDSSTIELVKKWCPEKQTRHNICSTWNSDDNFLYQLSYTRNYWPYECQLNSFDDAVVIDLSEHYNKRFIVRDTEVESEDFTMHLPLDQIGETIIWNGATFPIEQNLDNAISCSEQLIAVTPGNYRSVTFLATTVSVNLNFLFTVLYEDETSEQLTFVVNPAWSESREETESYFCCIVSEFDYFVSQDEVVDVSINCHSYTCSLPKNIVSKQIVGIILPDDTDIILYGMAISDKELSKNSVIKFEKVNINTFRRTEITLSSFRFGEDFHSIVYSPTDQLFYICTSDGFFSLTKTGQRTLINDEVNLLSGLAFVGETLYASSFASSGLYEINKLTGEAIGEPLQLTIPGDNIFQVVKITNFEGTLYALCGLSEVNAVMSVNTESGVCTSILPLQMSPDDLFSTESFLYLINEDDTRSYLFKVAEENSLKLIHEFSSTTEERPEVIAYNPDDSYLYHITDRTVNDDDDDYITTFEKLNLKTLEVTNIDIDGGAFSIPDGGYDMYDTGNIIVTNNSEEPVIYRSNISSGDPWFGENSQYFTKLFPGWFLLAAKDISINSFGINGGLGADEDGNSSSGQFVILDGAYTVFWKMVYGAGDPSVNHLIIVPGTSEGYEQFASNNTDDDLHSVDGLEGVDHIYYLLLSTKQHTRLFEVDLQDIAMAFMQIAPGKTLSQLKSAFEKNSLYITSLITEHYNFYIDKDYDVRDATAMCYIGDGKFLVFCEDKVCHINTNGQLTLLKQYTDANIRGLAMLNGILYGVLENGTTLAKIDPETGDFLNATGGGEDIFFDIDIECEKPLQGFRSLTNYDDTLYAIAKVDVPFSSDWNHLREILVTINEETGVATIVGRSDYFDSIAGIY